MGWSVHPDESSSFPGHQVRWVVESAEPPLNSPSQSNPALLAVVLEIKTTMANHGPQVLRCQIAQEGHMTEKTHSSPGHGN